MIGKTNVAGLVGQKTEKSIIYNKLNFNYTGEIRNIISGNGFIVIHPDNSNLYVSDDGGKTFEQKNTGAFNDIVFFDGKFFACGVNKIQYTEDFITWNDVTIEKTSEATLAFATLINSGFHITFLAIKTLTGTSTKYVAIGKITIQSDGSYLYNLDSTIVNNTSITTSVIIKGEKAAIIINNGYGNALLDDGTYNPCSYVTAKWNGKKFIYYDSERRIYKESYDLSSWLDLYTLAEGETYRDLFYTDDAVYGIAKDGTVKKGKTVSKMFASIEEYDFPVMSFDYAATIGDVSYICGSNAIYSVMFDSEYDIPTLNITLAAAKECYRKTIEAKEEVERMIEALNLGTADISGIGDGTIKGAIKFLAESKGK